MKLNSSYHIKETQCKDKIGIFFEWSRVDILCVCMSIPVCV